jgi:hypothetical protein
MAALSVTQMIATILKTDMASFLRKRRLSDVNALNTELVPSGRFQKTRHALVTGLFGPKVPISACMADLTSDSRIVAALAPNSTYGQGIIKKLRTALGNKRLMPDRSAITVLLASSAFSS